MMAGSGWEVINEWEDDGAKAPFSASGGWGVVDEWEDDVDASVDVGTPYLLNPAVTTQGDAEQPKLIETPEPPSYWDAIGTMFDRGGEILKDSGEEIIKGVPHGIVSGVGGIRRGNELKQIQSTLNLLNQLDAGESPDLSDPLIQTKFDTPEKRAALREELMRNLTTGEGSLGVDMMEFAEETFPAPEDQTMTTDVSRGVGSTVPYIAAGLASARGGRAMGSSMAELTKVGKLSKELGHNPLAKWGAVSGGYGAPAWLGMQHARQEVFEDALRSGSEPMEALEYASQADIVGLSEAVPIAGWVRKLDKASGGSLSKIIKDIAIEGSEEVVQELGSSFLKDLFAQSTYDPERDLWIWKDKVEEGEVAFSAAAVVSLITSLVSRRGGGATPQKPEILPPDHVGGDTQQESDLPVTTVMPMREVPVPSPTQPQGDEDLRGQLEGAAKGAAATQFQPPEVYQSYQNPTEVAVDPSDVEIALPKPQEMPQTEAEIAQPSPAPEIPQISATGFIDLNLARREQVVEAAELRGVPTEDSSGKKRTKRQLIEDIERWQQGQEVEVTQAEMKDPARNFYKKPLHRWIIERGGVDPNSPIGKELKYLDIKDPGFFNTNGMKSLDGIVQDEYEIFDTLPPAEDVNGYIAEDVLVDLLDQEQAGEPLLSMRQKQAAMQYEEELVRQDREEQQLGVDREKDSFEQWAERQYQQIEGQEREEESYLPELDRNARDFQSLYDEASTLDREATKAIVDGSDDISRIASGLWGIIDRNSGADGEQKGRELRGVQQTAGDRAQGEDSRGRETGRNPQATTANQETAAGDLQPDSPDPVLESDSTQEEQLQPELTAIKGIIPVEAMDQIIDRNRERFMLDDPKRLAAFKDGVSQGWEDESRGGHQSDGKIHLQGKPPGFADGYSAGWVIQSTRSQTSRDNKESNEAVQETAQEYEHRSLPSQRGADSLGGDSTGRVVQALRRHKTSILANGIAKDFIDQKHVRLIGQKVKSAEDLAILGQVYRNPAFETFRVFYTRKGKVVGQTGVTSRMPNVVQVGDISGDIIVDMERLEADGWWLLHNHPSGNPNPSRNDKRFTNSMAARARGFLGHIVVDHDKYGLVDEKGKSTIHPLSKSAIDLFRYDVNEPAVPHTLLGYQINRSEDAASVARSLAHDQDHYFQIVSRNLNGIRGIMDVPTALLDDLKYDVEGGKAEALALLHQFARQTGGGELFAMNVPMRYAEAIYKGIKEGAFLDVITTEGKSIRQGWGGTPKNSSMGIEPKTIRVNEVSEEKGDYRTQPQTTTVVVGKDAEGKEIKLQSSHPSLRDQSRLNTFAKRWFAKEGNLGQEAFERKIEADSLKSAEEVDNAFFLAELGRVVKRGYGKRISKLTTEEMETINEFLAGKEVEVPTEVRETLRNMRTYLDTLSARMQEMVLDNISFRLEVLKPKKRDAALAQITAMRDAIESGVTEIEEAELDLGGIDKKIAKGIRTFFTIEGNKGSYLNRSYQAFDDPKWGEKIRKDGEVMEDARNYLRGQFFEADPEIAENELDDFVEGAIGEILSGKYRDLLSFMASAQLGQKNLGVLRKRKEIAPEIRALMGEYTDPRVNFARSASKMSYLLANHHFLKSVREDGLGKWLTKTRSSGRMTTQITAFDADTMSPLEGLYTTHEMAQAFKEASEPAILKGWLRLYLRGNSAVKVGKTILAPTTTFRNFYSAAMFTVMNGHFNWSHAVKAAAVTWADLGGHKMKHKAYLRHLVEMGVLHDNPRAGELADLLTELAGSDPNKQGFHKRVFDVAQRIYRAGDDFWKIIGFENEKKSFIRSGMDEKGAEKRAAQRIRDGYPTYSMVPKGIRMLRRFPITGTFVSFPWEILRTSKNQARFIYEDAKAGRKKAAARRAVGVAVASSITTAISRRLMDLWGISDEDDEAVRAVAPPWQENAELAYTGFDENGMPTYLDLSHLDPYNYIKRPLIALTNGNYDGMEKVEKALTELVAPFLGLEITFSALSGILNNKDPDSGSRIWNEAAPADKRLRQGLDYLRKNLQPGFLSNIERTYKAFHEDYSRSGKKYDMSDELMAWIGFRFTTMNMKQAISFRAQDFAQGKRGAVQILSGPMGSQANIDDQEILDAYGDMQTSWEGAWKDMHDVINAAMALGSTREEIRQVLKGSGVSNRDTNALLGGETPQWRPSKQFMKRARKRALSTAPDETRKYALFDEFVRRREVLRDALEK